MKQKIYSILPGLIFGVLVICFLVGFSVLAWTEPTAVPPGGNVPAPINVGSIAQTKLGDLNIGGGLNYWITKDGNSFALKNNAGNIKFILGQDGNVGIGTTAPRYLTEISRSSNSTVIGGGNDVNLLLTNTNSTNNNLAGVLFQDASTFGYGGFFIQYVNHVTHSGDFYITTNNAGSYGERMRITAAGNVGIGTNAPNNKLDVEGGAVVGSTYSGTNTAPAEGLLVQGNVGIGTTSPGAKLEVAGQVKITGGTPGAGKVLTSDASGLASWQAAGGGSLVCVSRSVSQNQICDTICSNFGEVCTGAATPPGTCHQACIFISCGFCRCCKIQ